MVINTISNDGILEVKSYDGTSRQLEFSQSESFPERSPFIWNFFRQDSNHAYVRGKISYEGGCRNNVIISPYEDNRLINVRDAFVLVTDSGIEVSPVSDISGRISERKIGLLNKGVRYHVPKSVLERENLLEKDIDYLAREVKQRYGVKSRRISMIPSMSKMGGIYYIEGKDGHRYILKYRSKNKARAELLSLITQSIPDFFPRVYPRIDSPDYTVEMGDGWYGLESFFEGHSKEKNLDYFSLLGRQMALLHQRLAGFSRSNKSLEATLFSEDGYLKGGSALSFYLDLSTRLPQSSHLLGELERILNKDFTGKIDSLPKFLIHRDLNQSNILWINENPKVVDLESIMISTRISEFIPALVLGGNRSRPAYVKGSLLRLVNSYNRFGKNSLTHEEEKTLPNLLKYSLLRYYIVRTIRRNMDEENYCGELKRDLDIIGEESL